MTADITIINHGSILVLQPGTPDGREWLDEHIGDDAQTWGGGIVVEPRYVGAIVNGMIEDGLALEGV